MMQSYKSFYNRKLGGKQDSDTKRKALNAVKFKLVRCLP